MKIAKKASQPKPLTDFAPARAAKPSIVPAPSLSQVATCAQILALIFLCHQVYQWGGGRTLNADGTPRFAYQDAKGSTTGVPVEAGSLFRIALALESLAGTGPTTATAPKPTQHAQLPATAAK